MSELRKLIKLMKLEEKAKTCLTREEAQTLIRKSSKTSKKIWGPGMKLNFNN